MYSVTYEYSGLRYSIAENQTTQQKVLTTDAENEFSHELQNMGI